MGTRRRSRLGAGRLALCGTRTWTPPSLSRVLSVAHEQRAESSVSHAMRRTTAIASASGKRTVAIEPGRCALRATACWQRGTPPRLHRSLILHRHLVECAPSAPACVQTFAPKGTLSKGSIIQLHVVVVPRSPGTAKELVLLAPKGASSCLAAPGRPRHCGRSPVRGVRCVHVHDLRPSERRCNAMVLVLPEN